MKGENVNTNERSEEEVKEKIKVGQEREEGTKWQLRK